MKLSPPKCLLPVALLAGCGEEEPVTLPGPSADSPVVAGFERLHRQAGNLLAGGRLLAGELGCASCHDVSGGRERLQTKQAPRLRTVAERVHPEQLRALIAEHLR